MKTVFTRVMVASMLVMAGQAMASPTWFDEAQATKLVEQIRSASGVPSISAAIMRLNDSEAGVAASGVRRLGDPTPVTTGDRYHVGSNVKAMTSTAIGHLVEQGLLSWDTTIGQALGSSLPTLDASYQNVTMRELLSLRGGVPAIFTFPEMEPYSHFPGNATQQRAAVAASILSEPRAYPQGQTVYSNASYAIAASIAEHVSGQSWESMVRDQQLHDRMNITAEIGWPGQDGSDQPWGHIDIDGSGTITQIDPLGDQQFPVAFSPAGNMSMTLSDLALFGQQHLRALEGLSNTLGLSLQTVQDMHDAQGEPFAMGWADLNDPGIGGFGEGWIGSTDLFTSILLIDRTTGYAIAVAANGNDLLGNNPSEALFAAARALEASVVPAPGASALLMVGGVVVARRRRR